MWWPSVCERNETVTLLKLWKQEIVVAEIVVQRLLSVIFWEEASRWKGSYFFCCCHFSMRVRVISVLASAKVVANFGTHTAYGHVNIRSHSNLWLLLVPLVTQNLRDVGRPRVLRLNQAVTFVKKTTQDSGQIQAMPRECQAAGARIIRNDVARYNAVEIELRCATRNHLAVEMWLRHFRRPSLPIFILHLLRCFVSRFF